MFEDKVLVCGDCGQEFTFTAGEQEFFESKNLSAPKRCADCRKKKKMNQTAGGQQSHGHSRRRDRYANDSY